MRELGKRLILTIFLLLVFPLVVSASAEEVDITQIVQKGKDIHLYVSALEADGTPAKETTDDFDVLVGDSEVLKPTQTDVFETLDEGIAYTFCVEVSQSITERGMQEIKESLSDYIDGLGDKDFVQILIIGEETKSICDFTQNKDSMKAAVGTIKQTEETVRLYQGITYSLERHREFSADIPDRAMIVLFSCGVDSSGNDTDENQLTNKIAGVRIPIYVIGLTGDNVSLTDQAALDSLNMIVRKSGGTVFSEAGSLVDTLKKIRDIIQKSYLLQVQPGDDIFENSNQKWKVTYYGNGEPVNSGSYVYSLSKDQLYETAVDTQEEPENVASDVPLEDTDTLSGEEEDKGTVEKMKDFIVDNLFLEIAILLVIVAVVILIVMIVNENKRKKSLPDDSLGYSDRVITPIVPKPARKPADAPINPNVRVRDRELEVTVDDKFTNADRARYQEEFGNGDEKTISETSYRYRVGMDDDDEATVAVYTRPGVKVTFLVNFEGRQETIEKTLINELVLGRGRENCDVNVVLDTNSEARRLTHRKHATLVNRSDGIYVRDENTINKTYVNGVSVTGEMPVNSGDVLQLGNAMVQLRFKEF